MQNKQNDIIAPKTASPKNYSVAVVATMSAGKSTLLNAFMADDLLPTSNMACTSTVYSIDDNDKADNFSGRYITGSTTSPWQNVDRKKLSQWNTQKVDKIELKGNLPVIFNTDENTCITLLDTPGPNNSTNLQHARITNDIITKHDYSCIVCVLNSTVLATYDEKKLLIELQHQQEKRRNFSIYFVLNKIDELDIEKNELPCDVIEKLNFFLADIGFAAPLVIPTSASMSLNIRRLFKNSEPISEEDLKHLRPLVKNFDPTLPVFRCPYSRNRQKALINQMQQFWRQRRFYRQCLHDEKKLARSWLALRGSPAFVSPRQILIDDTFFSLDHLIKIDFLCGVAFLEKTLELDMLSHLGQSPSTYQLKKRIKKKQMQEKKIQ